jgi:hypothetical protein
MARQVTDQSRVAITRVRFSKLEVDELIVWKLHVVENAKSAA